MVVAAVGMVRVWSFTIDDAYISYRYARNFARGWGLVYNYGERIEGYTNFLWTVMLGGVHALGIDLDLGAKVLGAAATLVSVWLTYTLAARIRKVTWLPVLSTWVLASSMPFTGYGVFGLETPLFVALVLGGSVLFLREEDAAANGGATRTAVPWSAVVFGLAGLTRPEAPLFLGLWMLLQDGPRLVDGKSLPRVGIDRRAGLVVALVALAWLFVGYLHMEDPALGEKIGVGLVSLGLLLALVMQLPRRLFAKRNLVRGGVFVAIIGTHLLWRRAYYGKWVPNTLVAKTGDTAQQLSLGWTYLTGFIAHEGWVLGLTVFGLAVGVLWRRVELLFAAALLGLLSAYVLIVGGDWMPLFRFFTMGTPFIALLAGVGVRAALERRDRLVTMALVFFVAVVVFQRWRVGEADVATILHKHLPFWQRTATPMATWFVQRQERYGDAGRGLIAMGDIGEIGYASDFPVFDLLGLVDPVIAEQPGGYTNKTGKGYVDRFFERRPRYVVLIHDDPDCAHPYHQSSKVLYYDSRFKRSYVVSHAHPVDGWTWCIHEHRSLVPGD